MIKHSKAGLSLMLILTLLMSILTPMSVSAEEKPTYNYEKDGSCVMYKDGDYYRFLGPTGNLDEDYSDAKATISSASDYYKAHNMRTKDIASLQGNNLPSSVDLSESKYFPPVGNQGGLGSCATFSSVYYQFSYAVNQNLDVEATYDNTRSPQIVYNFINQNGSNGTYYGSNYTFLSFYGAPTMKSVPYSDQDDLNWHAYDGVWRESIRTRLKDYYVYENIGVEGKQITSPDDEDLTAYKTALNDGKVLGYSTFIYSWLSTTLKANPEAPENNNHIGEHSVTVCDGVSGGHAMTIVGYNDNIWTDINNNDKVDSGEMGAFKIVNSWGEGYCNNGFAWVAYDALNAVSSVEGVTNKVICLLLLFSVNSVGCIKSFLVFIQFHICKFCHFIKRCLRKISSKHTSVGNVQFLYPHTCPPLQYLVKIPAKVTYCTLVPVKDYNKFIASKTAANTIIAKGFHNTTGGTLKHFIAGIMTHTVIGYFESVNVKADKRKI